MSDTLDRLRGYWDLDAETYDHSASHALSDPVEAACWRAALAARLPTPPASVLDVGAGTGAISLLAAQLGHRVTALDLSEGMLSRAGEKARAGGLRVDTVVAPATDPPPGPFDAVVERHLLWTTPDPAAALEAWRRVAPGGRLILFEGVFSRTSRSGRLRDAAIDAVRRARGISSDHHGSYDPELLASLPLARATTLGPLLTAVAQAGWRAVRVERLRDVEWARRAAAGPVLGWLEHVDRFAVVADG